ncbi:hypothetical protein CBR_g38432 [Chara braunii]|uniref:HAT C-terminal dimerisation domain-containing protein n=1 Tax=Chara braunii TaxID=69332 RepID=A0A388JNK9_CHABU|nr:hypothetical protein CBR_g38432 [Chara braunii]|eukprot:GBG59406.1 hypothetical protein CBR_g38432 [Chara braunii]
MNVRHDRRWRKAVGQKVFSRSSSAVVQSQSRAAYVLAVCPVSSLSHVVLWVCGARELQRVGIKLKGSLAVYVREADREGELEFEHPLNWRLPGVVARQPLLVRARDLAQGRRGSGGEERGPPAPVARQDGAGHSAGVGPSGGGGPSVGVGPSGSAGPSSGGRERAGEGPSGGGGPSAGVGPSGTGGTSGGGREGAGEGPSGGGDECGEGGPAEHARVRRFDPEGKMSCGAPHVDVGRRRREHEVAPCAPQDEQQWWRDRMLQRARKEGIQVPADLEEGLLGAAVEGRQARHRVPKMTQTRLDDWAQHPMQYDLDMAYIRFFVGCGVPFNVARSEWYAALHDVYLTYLLSQQSPPVSLVRPGETRYGTNYIMLHRLLSLRKSLDGCVSSTAWATSAWLPALRDDARRCFDLLRDPQWWQQVELVTTIMGPIYELLQQVDSDGRRVGDVWRLLESLRITLDRLSLDEACHEPIKKIVKDRSDMMLTLIHCAAYLLHPMYRNIDLLMRGTVQERILDFHGKYPTTAHWRGPIGDAEIEQPDFDPVRWWRFWGGRHPTLRDVAMRCLGAWTTVSPCERNWSTHDFVHMKRRNRLGVEQLEKLVFCHWNLKLVQSSHARGGFIGAGLPGVGLTDVERRAEDYSRYEPDEMEPDTYDSEEIEREANRLRRHSRGRRLARAAVALAQRIRQCGEDMVHGEDVIDDDVSWLSEPYRGDEFLDGVPPPTVSPAGRMLPPRAPPCDRGVPAHTPTCEADSDSLRGDEFLDMLGATSTDDDGGGGGHPPEANELREAPRPPESDELREAALRPSSAGSVEGTLPPSVAPATDEATQHDTLAAAVEHDYQGRLIRRPGFTGPLDWWATSTISQDAEKDLAAYLPRPLSDLPRVDLDAEAGGMECREPFGAEAAAGEAVATEGGAKREDIARALEGAGYSVEEIEQTLAGYPEGHRHSTHHPGMRTRQGVDCGHARASPSLPLLLPNPSLALDVAGAGSHSSPVTDAQGTGVQCSGLRDHDSPGTGLRHAVSPMDCGAHSTMPLPPRDPSFIIEPLRPFVGRKRKAVTATGQDGGRSTGRGRARGRPSGEERIVGEGGISAERRWRGEGRARGEGRPRGRPPGRRRGEGRGARGGVRGRRRRRRRRRRRSMRRSRSERGICWDSFAHFCLVGGYWVLIAGGGTFLYSMMWWHVAGDGRDMDS